MRSAKWTLLLATVMLGVASGRTLMQGAPNIAPKCPKPTNLAALPADLRPVWTTEGTGTRNFTCVGGKPEFNGAYIKQAGDYSGVTYYLPPEATQEAGRVGYFVYDLGTVKYLGATLQNSTFPAPNGALSYGVWPMTLISGTPACDYLTRTNTTGGATPATCGATPEGGELTVPFTATFKCYACA